MSQLGSHGESFFSVGFCPRLGTPRGLTQSCTVQHCAGNPSDETKIKLGSIRVLFRPRREPEARAWDTPSQLHAAASSPEIQAHDCRRKHVNRGLCLTPKRAESCQWISYGGVVYSPVCWPTTVWPSGRSILGRAIHLRGSSHRASGCLQF